MSMRRIALMFLVFAAGTGFAQSLPEPTGPGDLVLPPIVLEIEDLSEVRIEARLPPEQDLLPPDRRFPLPEPGALAIVEPSLPSTAGAGQPAGTTGNALETRAALGVGTLAAYAQPGDVFRFYELDPEVVRLVVEAEKTSDHRGNLALVRRAGADDAHFDFPRRIFEDRNFRLGGREKRHRPRLSERQHAFWILGHEHVLDGEDLRVKAGDDLREALPDREKPLRHRETPGRPDDARSDVRYLAILPLDEPPAGNAASRIDSDDEGHSLHSMGSVTSRLLPRSF